MMNAQVLEKLLDVSRELAENRVLDPLLAYAMSVALELFGAEYGYLVLLDEGGTLDFRVKQDRNGNQLEEPEEQISHTILEKVTTNREALVIADAIHDPDFRDSDSVEALQLRSVMCVPLISRGLMLGAIYVENRSEKEIFDEDDLKPLRYFAAQAAVSIENAMLNDDLEDRVIQRTAELQAINEKLEREIAERKRAEEALREAAATAERNRLARDLHDAVTQTLFSASLIAEALPRVWERNPEEGRRGLEELRQLTRGALAEMRALLLELRPAALTEKPLGELLRHLTQAVTSRIRVPVTLTVEGDSALPPDVQIALYRIAQEALNNVARHAGASQSSVELDCLPPSVPPAGGGDARRAGGAVVLRIRDDGCGFDPRDILPDRLGVGIMRERAESIGATLEIESRPGHGAQVVVNWPDVVGRQSH